MTLTDLGIDGGARTDPGRPEIGVDPGRFGIGGAADVGIIGGGKDGVCDGGGPGAGRFDEGLGGIRRLGLLLR